MKAQIDRLGFEAWADNIIVNWMENMAYTEITNEHYDHEDFSLVIARNGDTVTAVARGYVEGKGWLTHERIIKLKGLRR